MSDRPDLLDRATRALREGGDANSGHDAGAARLALALTHRTRAKGRKRAMVVVLLAASFPLAALAANSSTVRHVIEETLERVTHPRETRSKVVTGHAAEPSHSPAGAPVTIPSLAPAPSPSAPSSIEPVPPSIEPAHRLEKSNPTSKPSATKSDDADALYRAAHSAHFDGHDPEAALHAWDRYLAAAPQGEFALEARYNRALTLVRLGRLPEAKAALEPFARGDYGGYRRREASELVHRIGSSPAP